jgi:HK97 family phage prohead protease
MEAADFSGYATKAGLVCSDGRVIMKDAFAHQDKETVPLVWQHSHDDPKNILGKAILEHREDGVYAYAFFNSSPEAQHVKTLVEHGDVVSLSIYANQLKERNKQVSHGMIRELSVVLAGANPGARIDSVRIAHSDGSIDTLEDEAVITMAEYAEVHVEHADGEEAGSEKGLQEILDTLNEEQRNAVNFVLQSVLEEQAGKELADAAQHSDSSEGEATTTSEDAKSEEITHSEGDESAETNPSDGTESTDDITHAATEAGDTTEGTLAHTEGNESMTRNVFDQNGSAGSEGATLKHDEFFAAAVADVKKHEGSLRESMLAHAAEYGIQDIEFLFPDAKAMDANPQLKARRMEWVAKVLDGTKHTPFAKVKSIVADITAEEARAKGYIKGNMKKDEVIQLLRRSTSPTTIYKKQRLDRDDVLDITDMDVVAFLKAEIRLMLEEEIARAILVGDGRTAVDEDKIKDPEGAIDGVGIRSILNDHDLYAIKHDLAANVGAKDAVKGLVRARSKFRGSGKPTLFISDNFLTDIMLEEDKFGRPLYETEQSLVDKLRVSDIVTVDLFDDSENLFAIMVNLMDYSIGANKGGQLTSFEDFDIDFNQHKYLQETRLSGGLTKPYSAIVVRRQLGTEVTPTSPSFDGPTNTITIPSVTGVVYQIDDQAVSGDVVITEDTTVYAVPDEDYYFPFNVTRDWSYTYTP